MHAAARGRRNAAKSIPALQQDDPRVLAHRDGLSVPHARLHLADMGLVPARHMPGGARFSFFLGANESPLRQGFAPAKP